MSRIVTVGAAQLGPVQRADSRAAVVARMLDLLRQAGEHRCDLVVFPELALTTFFPRWWMEDQDEIDAFFEREMPSNETAPLFNEARARGIGFYLGFAELARENGATRRFNTSILVDGSGREVGRYRKIHLPGHAEHEPWRAFQHLEKRYFEIGDLGWPVWRAMGGHLRHVHLQRPPLARDLSHDGAAGRRDGAARLQHAAPQPAGARPRPPVRVPQPALDAGRRLCQRHLGRRRREMRRRGGLRDDRQLLDHRADRRGRGAGADAGRRARRSPAATSTSARATRRRPSTSRATASPSSTA